MLVRHTLCYLPTQLLSPLAQLASMVLWTHWLAPEAMGAFTLVTVMQEMAYLACLGWFSTYALRYLPPDNDTTARQRYLATENTVVLACVALSLVLAWPATWTLPASGHRGLTALAVGLFFATRALNAHYAERARAQAGFGTYAILQLAGPVGGLLLGWLALERIAPTADVLLFSYALAQAVGTVMALPGLGMRWRLKAPDTAMLKAALAFGGPVLGLSALGWVAENHVRYLVQWQDSASALGLMIVGWSLGRRCASVAAMLVTTAAFPLASRLLNEGRQAEALRQLQVNAALMLAVLAAATVAMHFAGPELAALTVSPAYREVTGQLLGLSVLSGMLRNLHVHATDQLMLLQRRMGLIARISVIEILACGLGSAVGLWGWQLHGAVVGQAIGSALALGLSVWWARQQLGFVWPWADTLRIAAASSLMALAMALYPSGEGLVHLVGSLLCGGLAYVLGCAMLYRDVLQHHWRIMRAA